MKIEQRTKYWWWTEITRSGKARLAGGFIAFVAALGAIAATTDGSAFLGAIAVVGIGFTVGARWQIGLLAGAVDAQCDCERSRGLVDRDTNGDTRLRIASGDLATHLFDITGPWPALNETVAHLMLLNRRAAAVELVTRVGLSTPLTARLAATWRLWADEEGGVLATDADGVIHCPVHGPEYLSPTELYAWRTYRGTVPDGDLGRRVRDAMERLAGVDDYVRGIVSGYGPLNERATYARPARRLELGAGRDEGAGQ